ncbi:hypothetical protein [Nitrosomonas sp. Nm166]|nr:hypothetical protein [Nitrosomonas sp. Nm166]SFE40549.1 hypothetical protein SAMN05428977_101534 [Nitrosomonas sp. Nm166]
MWHNNDRIFDESEDRLNEEYGQEETEVDFEDLPMMQSFYKEA